MSINKLNYVVSSPIYGAAITAGGILYAIGQNKKIQQYTLPEEVVNRVHKSFSELWIVFLWCVWKIRKFKDN